MKERVLRKASLAKPSKDDRFVSTEQAKREWFLKPQHLLEIRANAQGGGAVWGVGRLPTYYSVRDLDRLALRVHGAAALEEKRSKRKKRAATPPKAKSATVKSAKRARNDGNEDARAPAPKAKSATVKSAKRARGKGEEEAQVERNGHRQVGC